MRLLHSWVHVLPRPASATSVSQRWLGGPTGIVDEQVLGRRTTGIGAPNFHPTQQVHLFVAVVPQMLHPEQAGQLVWSGVGEERRWQ